MHLVLEQALGRDTVPLPECQRTGLGGWQAVGTPAYLPPTPSVTVWARLWRVVCRRRWIGSPN
jgi:hypothetical protein